MTLDDIVIITSAVLTLVFHIGYQHCCKNVYLKYKDQRVGVRTKWCRK